tara:strand:- start:522 stop:1112 length:591 start_codon:yes stop_codon:yes gene_type:complete
MSLYFVGDYNVMYNKKLSPIDKLVYYCLVGFMNAKDGKCYPRYATIKERTGISIASIQRSIKHLARHNLITVKRLASTNLYFLGNQKILQETIKKRVITQSEGRDTSQRGILIKPSYITNNNRYRKRSTLSPPATDKHTLSYQGETFEEVGSEGHWHEFYSKKSGRKIRKHSFKNTIEEVKTSEKKFEAAAKRAVA